MLHHQNKKLKTRLRVKEVVLELTQTPKNVSELIM